MAASRGCDNMLSVLLCRCETPHSAPRAGACSRNCRARPVAAGQLGDLCSPMCASTSLDGVGRALLFAAKAHWLFFLSGPRLPVSEGQPCHGRSNTHRLGGTNACVPKRPDNRRLPLRTSLTKETESATRRRTSSTVGIVTANRFPDSTFGR